MLKELNAIETSFNFEWMNSYDKGSVTNLDVERQIVLQRAAYNYNCKVQMEAGYGYGFGYQSYHLELELNAETLNKHELKRIQFLDKDKIVLFEIESQHSHLERFMKTNLINVPMLVLRHSLIIRFMD